MTRGGNPGRGGGRKRGERGERGKRPGRTKHETSAGGVVYRQGETEPLFLLIRDSYGNWGFPKGHVESGERADTAALREVMEETGARAVTVRCTIETIEWAFRFRGDLIHKNCEFFLMQTDSPDTKPQRSEGITACKWAPLAEALELIGYENARAVLRKANALIAALRAQLPANRTPARVG
jgi:8-oxo-dGTP pyrophosphatase MutT (NUDIX family)